MSLSQNAVLSDKNSISRTRQDALKSNVYAITANTFKIYQRVI